MDGLLFGLIFLGIWVAVISVLSAAVARIKQRGRTVAADGHTISRENDITCEGKENHRHPQPSAEDIANYGRRYIVHDDPESGFVVLNGIKRRISDCKDL